MSTGPVYGRDMKAIEGGADGTHHRSEMPLLHFVIRTASFVCLPICISSTWASNPTMGLPEFAGLLKVDEQDPSKLVINNHSGHYKPESSIDVTAMILEIAPQQQSVSYAPIPESSSFDSALRIHSIDCPKCMSAW